MYSKTFFLSYSCLIHSIILKAREERKKSSSRQASSLDFGMEDSAAAKDKEQLRCESPQSEPPTPKTKMLVRLSAMQPHMAPLLRELKCQQNKKLELQPSPNADGSGDNQRSNLSASSNTASKNPFIRQQSIPKNLVMSSNTFELIDSETSHQKISENESSSPSQDEELDSCNSPFVTDKTVDGNKNEMEKAKSEYDQKPEGRSLHDTISSKDNVTNTFRRLSPKNISVDATNKTDDLVSANELTEPNSSITLQISAKNEAEQEIKNGRQSHFENKSFRNSIPRWQSPKSTREVLEERDSSLNESKYQDIHLSGRRSPMNIGEAVAGDDYESKKAQNENRHQTKGLVRPQLPTKMSAAGNFRSDDSMPINSFSEAISSGMLQPSVKDEAEKKQEEGQQSHVKILTPKKPIISSYRNSMPRWQSPRNLRANQDDRDISVNASRYQDVRFGGRRSPIDSDEIADSNDYEKNEAKNEHGHQIQPSSHKTTVSKDKEVHNFVHHSPKFRPFAQERTKESASSVGSSKPIINQPATNESSTHATSTKIPATSESGTSSLSFSKRADNSMMHSTLLKAKMIKRRRDMVKGSTTLN
jgi:hypothetical protein